MLKNISIGWRRGFVLFATFLFLTTVGTSTTSCKKKENKIGTNALDPENILISGGIDTFKLITYTVEDNNVITAGARYCILGIMNDPEFGVVDLGFYSQVRLSGLNPNFGDPSLITIDSFVLAMEYIGGYGYTGTQNFEVYEVDERMYADTAYKANQDLLLKPDNWVDGSGSYTVNPEAITVVGADTVRSQLRIKLDPAKAMQIIQDRYNNPNYFTSNTEFSNNYLKGLYVKTDGTVPPIEKGMVAYFDMTDNDSKMIIYYKENGVVRPSFDLVFNLETTDYNRFKIDNLGKRIQSVVADSTLGNVEFYAQSGKYRAKIDLPTIKNLPDNIVVHNAQLFLPIQQLPGKKFTAPSKISLTHPNMPGATEGVYNSYLKGYVVELRGFVQNVKLGNISSTTLTINTPAFVASAERVVFNGQLTNNKVKPRLIISYTEF